METTLVIDDDVLAAARSLAARQERSVGEVISDLSRQTLERVEHVSDRNGLPVLTLRPGAPRVTLNLVNTIRDLGA